MNTPTISIIGGTGGIGKWFARFFQKEGYTVHVSGKHSGLPIPDMCARSDVVIVSVPIGVTCDVIRTVGPHMSETSLLMDLTSLKEEPLRIMLEHSSSAVIGCHPLFGPRVTSLRGHTIVLCPARAKGWHEWVTALFAGSGASVIELSPRRHDELMSVVQGLNHLDTILMKLVMDDSGISREELAAVSTPLFEKKCGIIDKIFSGNPRLYAEIITMSPHIDSVIEGYERALAHLKELIGRRDAAALTTLLKQHGKIDTLS